MKTYKFRIIFALILILTISLSGLPVSAHSTDSKISQTLTEPTKTTSEMTPEEKAIAEFKAEVIRLVNIERKKAGAPAVNAMNELAEAADVRAKESAKSFSHTRPNNTRSFTVLGEFSLNYRAAGENLAYGFKTPEALVKAWMDSKSHRANILNPIFTYLGIGYYKNENGRIYASQLFYTPIK